MGGQIHEGMKHKTSFNSQNAQVHDETQNTLSSQATLGFHLPIAPGGEQALISRGQGGPGIRRREEMISQAPTKTLTQPGKECRDSRSKSMLLQAPLDLRVPCVQGTSGISSTRSMGMGQRYMPTDTGHFLTVPMANTQKTYIKHALIQSPTIYKYTIQYVFCMELTNFECVFGRK